MLGATCACACAAPQPNANANANANATNNNVLFVGGVFLQEKPSLTESEAAAHNKAGTSHMDVCQGPRDSVDACGRLEPGCLPLALPGAWSPCYGSGALCTETYREEGMVRLRANPPRCVCSCSPEFAAAIARDEALRRDPPP